jgi:Tyrosyl-DNA phosphodiesterase
VVSLHHSKTLFCFYPAFVRVVVSTGNFIRTDFERKTNGIWCQDFPLHTEESKRLPVTPEATDFLLTLQDYLKRIKLRPLAELLCNYDYAQVKVGWLIIIIYAWSAESAWCCSLSLSLSLSLFSVLV